MTEIIFYVDEDDTGYWAQAKTSKKVLYAEGDTIGDLVRSIIESVDVTFPNQPITITIKISHNPAHDPNPLNPKPLNPTPETPNI